MNKRVQITVGCGMLLPALFVGCRSDVTAFDPMKDSGNTVRNSSQVMSGQMLLDASHKAAQDALSDVAFRTFLDCYGKKSNGKMPVLKIGRIRNNSDDPELRPDMLLTPVADALFKAGKVRIFEDSAMREIRISGDDNNFPVNAENGKLLDKPDLILTGGVTTQTEKRKDVNMKITLFSVQITDLQTGMNLWRFSTSFGTKQTKPFIDK